ncbi:MAG TPA: Gfo/Idh/MocA family oxidoreductase [Mycobacteriales bacterium]|nr:Gfo/Idh/MocA family oxidoreductase [Mycobacteriales bacterium]
MTSASRPLRLGILGAGTIAVTSYGVLPNLKHIQDKVELVAVADPSSERAKQASVEFGIPEVYTELGDMLDKADIDVVVNLTPITFHGETSRRIVESGKHLVSEKPLGSTMDEADTIIETAAANNVKIVCAPPDMLHPPYYEARRLLDADTIGKVAFARVRSSHAGPGGGPGGWPLDPTWFYQEGSGPLLDMGVYGIHEITGLLGPAKRVTAFSGITEPVRVVRGGPFKGTEIEVTADDNSLFMLDFGGSTFAVVDGTFNVHASRSPKVEIFGRRGAMNIYDPRGDEPLEVYRTDVAPGVDGWVAPARWPALHDAWVDKLQRAILVDHLADCVRDDTHPVLSAEHARHALEIMLAVNTSARQGRVVELQTTF